MRPGTLSLPVLAAFAGAVTGAIVDRGVDLQSPEGDCFAFLPIDISGAACWDFQGDPDNLVMEVFIGAGAAFTCIRWEVTLSTVSPSWAEEATITFNDTVSISPAVGDAFTVSNAHYEGSMTTYVEIDSSGFLRIEFHEVGFDDHADAIDSYFGAGSMLYVGFPSPGVLGVFGFAGLYASRRRSADSFSGMDRA